MDNYILPDLEAMMNELLHDLVGEGQIGGSRAHVLDRYEEMTGSGKTYRMKDFDYILIRRRLGYLSDSYTDIMGLQLKFFAKDFKRAQALCDEATKRILASPGTELAGFLVDFAVVLTGPDREDPLLDDEIELDKSFEIHARVKWI